MNDMDLDKLISEGLIHSQAQTALRMRIKQESGQALIRGRRRRLWYRRAGMIGVVLLVAVAAFWGGRITTTPKSPGETVLVAHPNQDDDTILVQRDLITWLEAARFFKQLGMEERAHRAFQRASALTPSAAGPDLLAAQNPEAHLVNLGHQEGRLSSLLAQYDAYNQPTPHELAPRVVSTVPRNRISFIAQSMGGKHHDH